MGKVLTRAEIKRCAAGRSGAGRGLRCFIKTKAALRPIDEQIMIRILNREAVEVAIFEPHLILGAKRL